MRFAYIDSHGNEVPIPSVDALALRIELGAIGPETQLYDAQADHWGPANTHEIFHTLTRDRPADGFVAPPPPVAPPMPAPAAPTPKAKPAPPAKPKPKPEPATSAKDLGLTLADPQPEPPPKKSAPEPAAPSLDLSLDLAPPMDIQPQARAPLPDLGSGGEAAGLGGTFDYGDLGSGLQLEDSGLEAPGSPPAFGGGMPLETPMQFGAGGAGGGDLQLEEPMSAFQPGSPPGWMSEPSGGGVMDFSAPPEAPDAKPLAPLAETPVRQRREPKDRPSPPKFKKQSNLAGPIILVVLLLALGVGGYVGWPLLQARLNRPDAPVRPAVVMPSIPAELVPRMRALAEGAIADAIAEVDAATTAAGTPLEPDQQWLAGTYLADASQYAGVAAFWNGIGDFLQGVRGADWQLYHDKLVARVAAEGIAADTAAMLVERADSGFVAAGDAREQAYATVDRLVEASLSLHEYLVANEANIEYRPATTSTADPILEAVPNNTAIGDRMLEMVDEITEALADLGSLDRVTRERLTSALAARLQQVGVQ